MDDSTQTSVAFGDIVRPFQIAYACSQIGWRVIPLRRDTKRPALKRWPELATTDLDTVQSWWNMGGFAACLCGVVTGVESDLWVLDVDRHDADGFGALAKLESEHGQLPTTFTVNTPSGGRHFYWRWPNSDERAVRNSGSDDGLDVRGRHGQVVAPFTEMPVTPEQWAQGMRRRRYEPTALLVPVPLPYAPDWLVEWTQHRREHPDHGWIEGDHRSPVERDADWVENAASVGVGGRHNYFYRGLCSMRARDVDPAEMLRLALQCGARFPEGTNPITEAYVRYQVDWVIKYIPPGQTRRRQRASDQIAELYRTKFGGTK